jgi:hypothetical protein
MSLHTIQKVLVLVRVLLSVDVLGVNGRGWKHTVDVYLARCRDAVVGRSGHKRNSALVNSFIRLTRHHGEFYS